jgi:hypothetical protein
MNVKPLSLIPVLVVLTVAAVRPVGAHHTTADSTCAPIQHCLFAGCWYEVLNNPNFSGTYPTCTDWSNISVSTSSECFNSKVTTLTPTSGAFSQSFAVPSDATGLLNIALEFATLGTPASWRDTIVVELYEGGLLRSRLFLDTPGMPTSCHREDLSFGTGYAGRNLQLRVRASFGTVGVSYKVNSVVIFANL